MRLQDAQRTELVGLCQAFHRHTHATAAAFAAEAGRRTYVTPTSYLELIAAFTTLLATKRAENAQAASRYTVGLEKLAASAAAVAGMQAELTALQPQLVATVADVEALMARVAAEKRDVVEPKAEVRPFSLRFWPPSRYVSAKAVAHA